MHQCSFTLKHALSRIQVEVNSRKSNVQEHESEMEREELVDDVLSVHVTHIVFDVLIRACLK